MRIKQKSIKILNIEQFFRIHNCETIVQVGLLPVNGSREIPEVGWGGDWEVIRSLSRCTCVFLARFSSLVEISLIKICIRPVLLYLFRQKG